MMVAAYKAKQIADRMDLMLPNYVYAEARTLDGTTSLQLSPQNSQDNFTL